MNIPNEPACNHEYEEKQAKGIKVRKYLVSKSADQSKTNSTHISVWLVPFVHSQTWQRPYDLRLQEAKLDAFINWIDKEDKAKQSWKERHIPVETIESDLRQMCIELEITTPTITRGNNLKLYLTHNKTPAGDSKLAPEE